MARQAAAKQVLMITACPVQLQDVEVCFGGIQRWTQIVAKQGLAGIRLHFVDTTIRNISRFQGESLWVSELSRACNILISLVRHVVRQRFNLVHINCPPTARGIVAAWVYARLVRLRRIPVAVHYHDDISQFAVKPTVRSGLWPLRRLARMADANIVLDRGSGECIEEIAGSRGRTFVLPNFLEDSILQHQSDNRESALPGRVRILLAGQVIRRKGCAELLEAARQLAEADFVLLGVVNKDMAERVRNLPTNVKIVDQVPQDVVLQEMMASDIFVLPSYHEGFPMAVLEAMAVGLPVVTTRAGALPEMVEDGKGGLIVQRRNVPALVSALRMLMNDPARRKRMATFNREKVRAQYTYSMVAPQLMAIYEQIGGASRNPARRSVAIK